MADSIVRSTLIELFTRLITVNDKNNVYNNGVDNNYPERIERIVNNSTTAKSSANKLASYIFGKGFENLGDEIINKAKNLTFNDILYLITQNVKYHKSFYLHVNYDIEGNPNYLDVLPCKNSRITKDDNHGYSNAIYYAEKWGERKFSFNRKSEKAKWFYPYNNSLKVITAQREKDAKGLLRDDDTIEGRAKKLVTNYRGQVLFVNLEPENIYPLAYIDASYYDADSEYYTSSYKNGNLKSGFVGKMVATILQGTDKNVKKGIEEDLANTLGSNETGNIMLIESKLGDDGKLLKVIDFTPIPSNVDDKLFKHTEESIEKKILMAYQIPPALVIPSNKLYGSSGEEIKQMKLDFQESNERERMVIESTLNKLFKGTKTFKIKKLVDD